MINFISSDIWEKFGSRYLSDPTVTTVDLSACNERHEYILEIEKHLHGADSNRLQTGNSLDALADVLSDYFFEFWLKSPQIYLLGWQRLTISHPVFSQKLLLTMVGAYENVIWGQARAVYLGDAKIESAMIHEEIQNGMKLSLVLN